jgi:hypothetical protein
MLFSSLQTFPGANRILENDNIFCSVIVLSYKQTLLIQIWTSSSGSLHFPFTLRLSKEMVVLKAVEHRKDYPYGRKCCF